MKDVKKNEQGFSKAHIEFLAKKRREKIAVNCCRVGVLVVVLALWELLAFCGAIDAFITSSPSRIAAKLAQLAADGELFKHAAVTLGETLAGFVIATVVGTLVAIGLWWCEPLRKTLEPHLRKTLEPHLVILNALPKIALGPIIIIWMGSGAGAIVFMAVLICVIITVIGVLSGFMQTDKGKLTLMDTLGATKRQKLTMLVLPANIPTIVSALKINVGLSWVGSIMGEYLVSRAGLGYLIIYGGQVFDLDLVMASTIVLCVLAAAMYGAVALFEKAVAKKFDAES